MERFKQAFSRPGSMSAALNYYRAVIDAATWAPPTTKRRAATLTHKRSPGFCQCGAC